MGVSGAKARAEAVSRRGKQWVERQDVDSPAGVAISAWRHYRFVDGPLQSALLSLYVLVAVLPALLVMEEYLDPNPNALAARMAHHYHLNAPTTSLLHSVLGEGRQHELGSAMLAIAGALFFGLGFGRVLQLVYARAWGLALQRKTSDLARYAAVLMALYGLILLLLVQLTELEAAPSWARLAVSPGWIAVLSFFFAWAPRSLTHGMLAWRDLFPVAAVTALGLVVLMIVSSLVMELWIDFYARDYGGFGVVMAIFFWIGFSSFVIVACASVSPALAERR